ncbi:TonB-dependent receptor domain-containing protein [Mucilaginibacter terrae]|uniref:TonB-dependent receptor domain-containing protein n=1 Tax=Mucilaginibacter terrae TaxID=1955052 RepID=UPI00363978C7
MKKLILVIILCFYTCVLTFAQTTPATTATIKGSVIDSVKKEPLSYVTVALIDATTNVPVKSTFTKDDGSFTLAGLTLKAYKISLVNVGFATKTINLPKPETMNDLGKLLMSAVSGQLKEVNVVAVRPLMKREVDRISYDVQADPENKVITVLDMMRRVPLLSVDATDNIKLQGNTNFKILINGKESALIARNPSDIFKSMPASNIERIEVITTPPAKYDAEGLAGIINIITKKDISQGYNGSINARYSNLWGPGANLNLTIKKGKFGIGGYTGYNKRNNLITGFSNFNNNFETDGTPISSLNQQGSNTNTGHNTYASTELTYEGDSLNLLTGTFEYYRGQNDSEREFISGFESNIANVVSNAYRSLNTANSGYRGLGAGLNYQLGFKRSKEQLLTTSYKYNSSKNDQFNDIGFTQRLEFTDPNYRQYNNSGSKEHTLQLDYVQPVKKLNIEAGAKAIFRNNFSDAYTENQAANASYVVDPKQVNAFDYQQNVYSLYNSYQMKFSEKWVAKGGLRLEHTTVNASEAVDQKYSNLIPSLSLQRSFKSSSINIGYTDRIQRPGIWQLNPFIDKSNNTFISVGNPNLRPVVNHSVELTYSNFKKGSFNFGLNYKFANNTVENVTVFDPATGVSLSSYQNVGNNKRLGFDFNANYPITTKFNVNINSQLVRVWLKGFVNSTFFNTSGYQGHIFAGGSYKFDNGYRVGANFDYDSRYVLLQGRDNYWLGYSASVSKEFLDKKATISVYASNPFQKFRTIDNTVRTPTSSQLTLNDMYARAVNISINYKFGKLSGELKKNQRGINNDDVGGSGRN